jgi:hypothetical protein
MEVSGQLQALATLIPDKDPGTHWIEGWMVPRVGLDTMAKTKIPFPSPASYLAHSLVIMTELPWLQQD